MKCNEKLHNLYFSANIIRVMKTRRMRWAGHVARMEVLRSAYKILVLRKIGRHRRRCEENVKIVRTVTECEGMDWIQPAQDRFQWRDLANKIMDLRAP
jgi:hypothetical protein